MKLTPFLALSFLVLFFGISCKKGGKTGLLVPKDAAVVIHINTASLTSKLSWEEISQTDWFKEMSNQANDSTAQRLLKDPGHSGIDTKSDLVFFMKRQGRGGYLVFEGSVKDAATFEAFNKEINKGAATSKEGGINYMPLERSGMLAWNNSKFAYVADSPLPDMQKAFEGNRNFEMYKFPVDSLKKFGKDALNLESSDNLDNDSRFASMIKDGSDMHLWLNVSGIYGNSLGGMVSMMKFNLLLEDNISATSLNFDDGKITMKAKGYYSKEMSKLLADYPAKPISVDVLNRIPSQNVIGVAAMNFPPDGLKEFLKVTGFDGMANGFLGRMGYSVDEFIKSNKGEVLLAVTDLEIKAKEKTMDMGEGQEPYKYSTKAPDMKVLLATAVNDKAAFDKLIGIVLEQTKGISSPNKPEIHYKLDNNWFAASNSADHMNKFLSGESTKNAVAEKISGHPVGFYVDIQKIIKSTESSVTDSTGKTAMTASLNMWEDIIATGGEYKDKALHFQMEVNLVDKNTNSLKQLNQYINNMYKINQEKKNRYKDSMTDDIRLDTVSDAPAVRP